MVGPPPVNVVVDEPADEGSDGGTDERREREHEHRRLQLAGGKEIAHGTARHGEERATGEAVKESSDKHGGHVLGHSLGNNPDDVHGPRDEVDGPSAVELAQGAHEQGAEGDAENEQREAQRRDDARVAKLGLHLGICRRVDGASCGSARL